MRGRTRTAVMAVVLGVSALSFAQTKPPTDPAVVATIHRLVLTSGDYQQVRRWEVKGDRVRYISSERNGEWEEMPVSLVDWAATLKYAHQHTPAGEREEAASADAKAIDAEEAAERAEISSRTPEVAPHLHLPDKDGVWVLDYYQNQPELVTLEQNSGDVNQRTGHNVLRAAVNPLAGKKQEVRLDGAGSKVHLHENAPVFYVSLTTGDSTPGSDAMSVDTHGAKMPEAQSSPTSQYAIVAVEPRRDYRVVTNVNLSALGKMTQTQDVVPATATVLPGGHWLKVTPKQPLAIGQYALMEMLDPRDINLSVWDFAVEPQAGDNVNTILPLVR
jgi:hypothetical protein